MAARPLPETLQEPKTSHITRIKEAPTTQEIPGDLEALCQKFLSLSNYKGLKDVYRKGLCIPTQLEKEGF